MPARYNFNQGYIYRLKITNIPGRPGTSLYPTIEVAPTTPATDAYLAHNAIPVQFTAEDFDQVIDGGNFVTKVIYLPDPKYQELAVSGVETLVSTRLEPGIDPILEADKRGTILLIVRLGCHRPGDARTRRSAGTVSSAPVGRCSDRRGTSPWLARRGRSASRRTAARVHPDATARAGDGRPRPRPADAAPAPAPAPTPTAAGSSDRPRRPIPPAAEPSLPAAERRSEPPARSGN